MIGPAHTGMLFKAIIYISCALDLQENCQGVTKCLFVQLLQEDILFNDHPVHCRRTWKCSNDHFWLCIVVGPQRCNVISAGQALRSLSVHSR